MMENIFRYSYRIFNRKEIDYYDDFMLSKKKSLDMIVNFQTKQVCEFLHYCNREIPYYKNLFESINFNPNDFNSLDDLKYLPILTKDIIRENYNDFFPVKKFAKRIYPGSTGGSTGEPLKYFMSDECYERGVAIMYRGWSYAGYKPGDKILIFAGSSLVGKSSLTSRIVKFSRNFKSISSYGVSDSDMYSVLQLLEKWNPAFVRGYASSIFLLAQYILNSEYKHLQFPYLKAIFTTAEMLHDNQRHVIEKAFGCKVYNQYGLNDGGISAFENGVDNGFIIDTERALLECVDERGINQLGKEGQLLATSFYNKQFPFLRYNTGDLGKVEIKTISTGEKRLVLANLYGRVTDSIKINDRIIGSPVLTVLLGKVDVLRYQIIQEQFTLILILRVGKSYTADSENFIRTSLLEHLGDCKIKFDYKSPFIESKNKHKFIINNDEI